jgi:hypothetical protein
MGGENLDVKDLPELKEAMLETLREKENELEIAKNTFEDEKKENLSSNSSETSTPIDSIQEIMRDSD